MEIKGEQHCRGSGALTVLPADLYAAAINLCRQRLSDPSPQRRCVSSEDALALGVVFDTLQSIFVQQHLRHVKRTAAAHRTADAVARYRLRFEGGEHLADIADSVNYSPYSLARGVLKVGFASRVPFALFGLASPLLNPLLLLTTGPGHTRRL